MLIRSATPADVSAMMALERATALAAHWPPEQYESALGNSEPRRVCMLIESESSGETHPQLMGFIMARELDREWEIENILISETARHQGLGLRLLTALLDLARTRGATAIFLEVRESNFAARKLYEKAGFIHSGLRPGYYRDPEEGAALYRLIFL